MLSEERQSRVFGRKSWQVDAKEVPAGLHVCPVDIMRMQELSSATGANGNEPCYGVLDFPDMKAARNHPAEDDRERMVQLGHAPFIVVNVAADPQQVLDVMEQSWNMPRPGALFSIAGGVSNLKVHTVLAKVLTRGLAQAVSVTGAWVVTGGMDAGVSRLLGTGLRKSGCLSPVIGVTPWGILPAARRVETRRETRHRLTRQPWPKTDAAASHMPLPCAA